MNEKTYTVIFPLIKSAVLGEPISEEIKNNFEKTALFNVFNISKMHDVAHIVGAGLRKNGLMVKEDAVYEKFRQEEMTAVMRYERINYEIESLRKILADGKIPFMLLKGAVIRKYYPQPWMRTSCDIDVLVHEETLDDAVKILKAHNYRQEGDKNFHDVSLFSPSGVHLELHYTLKENMAIIDKVLEQVWDYSFKDKDGDFEFFQTNEFLLYHLLAHMSYHFVSGGCGIRSFLDIYILTKSMEFDENKLRALCDEASLTEFYNNVKALAEVWFGGKEHSELTLKTENYIVRGGVYGTIANSVLVSQAQKGGKFKNIMHRIFLPYDTLKYRYKVLEKHKWLTPFFWVVRWFSLLKRDTFKRSVNELKANRNSDEKIKETADFLSEVGLSELK